MKKFEGLVISTSKDTVVVEIERKKPHPLYKKLMKVTKKYKVDPNGASVEIGQKVKIVETKPISKQKYFKIENNMKGNK